MTRSLGRRYVRPVNTADRRTPMLLAHAGFTLPMSVILFSAGGVVTEPCGNSTLGGGSDLAKPGLGLGNEFADRGIGTRIGDVTQ